MNRLFSPCSTASRLTLLLLIAGCGGTSRSVASNPETPPATETALPADTQREAPTSPLVDEAGRFRLHTVDSALSTQTGFEPKGIAVTPTAVWTRDRLRYTAFSLSELTAPPSAHPPVSKVLTDIGYRESIATTPMIAPVRGAAGLYFPYYKSVTLLPAGIASPVSRTMEERIWGIRSAPAGEVAVMTASWAFRRGTLTGLVGTTLETRWQVENVIADGPFAFEGMLYVVQDTKNGENRLLEIDPRSGATVRSLPLAGTLHGPLARDDRTLLVLLEAHPATRGTSSLIYMEVDIDTFAATYRIIEDATNWYGGDIRSSFITLGDSSHRYRAAALLKDGQEVLLLGPKESRAIPLPSDSCRDTSRPGRLARLGDTLLAAVGNRLYLVDLGVEKVAGFLAFHQPNFDKDDALKTAKINRIDTLGDHLFVQTEEQIFHLVQSETPSDAAYAVPTPARIAFDNWPISVPEALTDGDPKTAFTVSDPGTLTLAFPYPVLLSGVVLSAKSDAPLPRAVLNGRKTLPADEAIPRADISAVHTISVVCEDPPCAPLSALELLK